MRTASLMTILAVICTTARADSPRTDINPVLLYSQAFLVAPDLPPADHDYLFTNDWGGQKLPEKFGSLISRYDNEFNLVRQAARSTVPADWGIDWSAGPNTLLPHLARVKTIAQAAQLRVMWDLQHDRQNDACDDLVAALAAARNVSRDGCLISTLVQDAAEAIVYATVAGNFGHLTPESLQRIHEGFAGCPPPGLIASTVPVEKACKTWFMDRLQEAQAKYPGDNGRIVESIRPVFEDSSEAPDQTNLWHRIMIASGGSPERMIQLLREMDPLYKRLAEVLVAPLPEFTNEMNRLMQDVRTSQNPFVTAFFPAYEKCRTKEFAAEAARAMIQAAIEYKLHGHAAFDNVTDPFGNGPFTMERFVFKGADRGFKLQSAYDGRGFQEVLIFVEKDGPTFAVNGRYAGKAPPYGTAALR